MSDRKYIFLPKNPAAAQAVFEKLQAQQEKEGAKDAPDNHTDPGDNGNSQTDRRSD